MAKPKNDNLIRNALLRTNVKAGATPAPQRAKPSREASQAAAIAARKGH